MVIHPSRETRYGTVALSQKGNTCIQVIFTQSSVSLTTTPEYLPVSGFNVPSLHLSQSSRLHPFQVSQTTATIRVAKVIPDLPVTLHNCPNSGQRKTWKQTHSKVSCFVSSSVQNSFHFLHSPGRFHWLTVLHAQLKHFHNCSSNHGCYLMHLRNQDQRSQTGGVHMSLSLTPLSTNSLNTKFHCAFSAMTVPISLSQHSSTYTARQTTMLQASISRLPVSANIRQAPLFLHTTEPQVFNYSRLISHMWQSNSFMNQGHWQSKLDPPGPHATVSLSLCQNHQAFQWLSRLSLPKSPPQSLSLSCQSHQTSHTTKMQISHATQLQHTITCSSVVVTYFPTLTTTVRNSIAYIYHISHTTLGSQVF